MTQLDTPNNDKEIVNEEANTDELIKNTFEEGGYPFGDISEENQEALLIMFKGYNSLDLRKGIKMYINLSSETRTDVLNAFKVRIRKEKELRKKLNESL